MVLISGTQGEPMSALARAAVDNHRHAKIEPGDTVVLSSRIIPGNEKGIYRVIDHLFRRDAKVIYDDGSKPPVHVSGHASQEELKLMINLVRPRYFIPIHGEYRQLKRQAELAGEMKGAVGNVLMIETGDIWSSTNSARGAWARPRWAASALTRAPTQMLSKNSSSVIANTSARTDSSCRFSP